MVDGGPSEGQGVERARDARDMAANTMMSANAVTLAASLAGPSLARMAKHLGRIVARCLPPPALLSAADPSPSLRTSHRIARASGARSASLSLSRRHAPPLVAQRLSRRSRRSSSSSSLTRRRRRCRSSSSSSASRRRRSRFLLPPLGLRRGRRWMPPPLHALGNGGCAWRERETGVGPLDG